MIVDLSTKSLDLLADIVSWHQSIIELVHVTSHWPQMLSDWHLLKGCLLECVLLRQLLQFRSTFVSLATTTSVDDVKILFLMMLLLFELFPWFYRQQLLVCRVVATQLKLLRALWIGTSL